MIDLCVAAHENHRFEELFTWVPDDGRHVLAHRGSSLVSHALATTRWRHPEGS